MFMVKIIIPIADKNIKGAVTTTKKTVYILAWNKILLVSKSSLKPKKCILLIQLKGASCSIHRSQKGVWITNTIWRMQYGEVCQKMWERGFHHISEFASERLIKEPEFIFFSLKHCRYRKYPLHSIIFKLTCWDYQLHSFKNPK